MILNTDDMKYMMLSKPGLYIPCKSVERAVADPRFARFLYWMTTNLLDSRLVEIEPLLAHKDVYYVVGCHFLYDDRIPELEQKIRHGWYKGWYEESYKVMI